MVRVEKKAPQSTPCGRRRRHRHAPDPRWDVCGNDAQTRRLVQDHLALLRTWRAEEVFAAFLWPADVQQVHSVIDHTYAREPQDIPTAHRERCTRLEERTRHLEALRQRDGEGA